MEKEGSRDRKRYRRSKVTISLGPDPLASLSPSRSKTKTGQYHGKLKRRTSVLLMLAGLLMLTACAAPATRLDHQAQSLGMQAGIVEGDRFKHRTYSQQEPCAGGRLHVYLEGDGLAWLPGNRVSLDPTPPHSCLMPLMAMDTASAVYLGRPCYHGFANERGCHPSLWTQGRYGEQIIQSMVKALLGIMPERKCQAVLIGYSGGGAMAMLIASRMSERIRGVVTLAGNLNVEDWTTRHGYAALDQSKDPAHLPPLPPSLFQIHVAGGKDDNIPATVIATEAARQKGARYLLVPQLAHDCPEPKLWNGILTGITLLEKNNQTGKKWMQGTSGLINTD